MNDKTILEHINELAEQEHALFEKETSGSVTEKERAQLSHLKVTLDQCWDLLRQRRARRSAGLDPDDAVERDEKTVEGYVG